MQESKRKTGAEIVRDFALRDDLKHLNHDKKDIIRFVWQGRTIDLRTVSVKVAEMIARDPENGVLSVKEAKTPAQSSSSTPPPPKPEKDASKK